MGVVKSLRARSEYTDSGLWWGPFTLVVLGPALAWLVGDRLKWDTRELAAVVSVVVAVSIALATLWERRLDKRHAMQVAWAVSHGLSPALLEEWRGRLRAAVIDARVEQGGQLDQMIRHGVAVDMHVRLVDSYMRRPRFRVGAKLLAWSEILREWDESTGRLVILGDPGYGKTVAALTLVAHINASGEPGASVAELFSLADWYRWQADHRGSPFGDWLAEQLTMSYPSDLPVEVSRQLVAERLILPVLDGLDEIPTMRHRRACVDEIDAYARRASPHRQFVLTCRATEYNELAPDWVNAEWHIELAGLQPDQVDAILDARTSGRTGWDIIRTRHAAGNAVLGELFRSPLRLMIALEAYRDRDASELLDLSVAQARGRLWELLLSNTAERFRNATPAQVRGWLVFLAAGMRRTSRQRLMLHELYLIDPDRATSLRRFGGALAATVALAAGLLVASGLGGSELCLTSGSALGLICAVLIAVALTEDMVTGGTLVARSGSPTRFAHRRPDALLTANRNSGLVCALVGLACGLTTGAATGAIFGLSSGLTEGLTFGLYLGIPIGLVGSLVCGLVCGLDMWLYYYWLRWRLYARGLLPSRLPEFLGWCSEPPRGWLRVTNAYEFRHRELLDYLAPPSRPIDAGWTPVTGVTPPGHIHTRATGTASMAVGRRRAHPAGRVAARHDPATEFIGVYELVEPFGPETPIYGCHAAVESRSAAADGESRTEASTK